jgi:uncharacterized protein YcfJ
MRKNSRWRNWAAALALLGAGSVGAQVVLYEHDGFQGNWVRADRPIYDLQQHGFNDRASSVVVEGGSWEVCVDAQFGGHCAVLRKGDYESLRSMGLNDRISSVREVYGEVQYYDRRDTYSYNGRDEYRRRPRERLFEADVTSVRAVFGPPEQRCWVEQEQAVQGQSGGVNVPGAIAGAVIGGILGHQIGSGRGQDIATAGGAVGGAALGANIGRGDGQSVITRDVQRCEYQSRQRPAYWDVTYVFRGVEHQVQTTTPPGATITVNGDGEPRA